MTKRKEFRGPYLYRVDKMPKHLYRELYDLNLTHSGRGGEEYEWDLRRVLVACRHYGSPKDLSLHTLGYVHLIFDTEGRIASWCITFKEKHYGQWARKPITYFYTRRMYRRKGLARLLGQKSRYFSEKKFGKVPFYVPHDETSSSFFKNLRKLTRK